MIGVAPLMALAGCARRTSSISCRSSCPTSRCGKRVFRFLEPFYTKPVILDRLEIIIIIGELEGKCFLQAFVVPGTYECDAATMEAPGHSKWRCVPGNASYDAFVRTSARFDY